MAIVFDTFQSVKNVLTTTATKNMTVAAGTNKALIVLVTNHSIPAGNMASVTWNTSESFTYITNSHHDNTDIESVEGWYLLNPTSTTANVVVDWNGATAPSATVFIWSLQGVDQNSPIGTVDELPDIVGLTTLVNSITTTARDSWVLQVLSIGGTDATGRIAPVNDQIERYDAFGGNNDYDTWAGDLLVPNVSSVNVNLIDVFARGDWSQQLAVEVKASPPIATGAWLRA